MSTRRTRANVAEETLDILDDGYYLLHGQKHNIKQAMSASKRNTLTYMPHDALTPQPPQVVHPTQIRVVNQTTMAAARAQSNANVAILNFASARRPGGGFLSGANAQEESIARASSLYETLKNSPMYRILGRQRDPRYANFLIYSPNVVVFRNDDNTLIAPWQCSVISAPAVNAGVVRQRKLADEAEITSIMTKRIERVLAVAQKHGHVNVVLGAWGCGVFKNDPKTMSRLFQKALQGTFKGVFKHVIFAIKSRQQSLPAYWLALQNV